MSITVNRMAIQCTAGAQCSSSNSVLSPSTPYSPPSSGVSSWFWIIGVIFAVLLLVISVLIVSTLVVVIYRRHKVVPIHREEIYDLNFKRGPEEERD